MMSAYYGNQQPSSPSSPSPPAHPANSASSMAAAAAAAAFHWNAFSEFSPYYFPNHQNINARYQHQLQGYHHHNHHNNHHYANPHQHQGSFTTAHHAQQLFGSAAAAIQQQPTATTASPAPSPTAFAATIKTDLEDRNQNFVRSERENYESGTLSNQSTPTLPAPTPQTVPGLYMQQQQHLHAQQQQQQQQLSSNNNSMNHHMSSCTSENNNTTSRDFDPSELTPPQTQHNHTLGVQHPGSSPNFGCISPASLGMSGNDPASAMAAMNAGQGGYYDMYGAGGSFGAKGSSFYPWMKNYAGKTETKNERFAIIMVICLFTTPSFSLSLSLTHTRTHTHTHIFHS